MELSPPSLRFLPSREAGLSGGGRGYPGATKGHAAVGRRLLKHLNGQRQLQAAPEAIQFLSAASECGVSQTGLEHLPGGGGRFRVRPCNTDVPMQ